MVLHLTQLQRLSLVIGISLCFFLAEISVGFYTKSLALVADAFHYLNDIIGFIVAFAAVKISSKKESPKDLSFGWQRARLLGAFFNGVFLLALGVSIFLQSIERFISPQVVESPKLVLIIGCVGLALNILSASFLHEHDHSHDNLPGGNLDASAESGINEVTELANREDRKSAEHPRQAYAFHTGHRHNNLQAQKKGYDLGLLGVFIHVLGDAFNNVGVIISALIIWLTHSASRYYADPAISMAIALMIMGTSIPLVRNSGLILLNSVPKGIDLSDVKHDLELLPEVSSIHELHAWRLNQEKALASVHVGLPDIRISEFVKLAKTMNECFHSYGIHSAIVQPELVQTVEDTTEGTETKSESCQITCGSSCELLTCCG
ncbi:cation diffusion facilitator family metal ion transporter [Aspergillus flavus]|nr:cation diffusion facilitator family metal ion transporter [Aspergillus flavus AF70]RAQ73507.1 cation diffusion facilitator family metal ion transporter [Aspergillus flavus]RAQ74533.1 cation diffusion facilitator family metal ion transporter [Aspergillus flavus]